MFRATILFVHCSKKLHTHTHSLENHLHTGFELSLKFKNVHEQNIEHSTWNKLDAYHSRKKQERRRFPFPVNAERVQNESSDKYTCIDCNVSYFFGVSYKFTSCTIFMWRACCYCMHCSRDGKCYRQFCSMVFDIESIYMHLKTNA